MATRPIRPWPLWALAASGAGAVLANVGALALLWYAVLAPEEKVSGASEEPLPEKPADRSGDGFREKPPARPETIPVVGGISLAFRTSSPAAGRVEIVVPWEGRLDEWLVQEGERVQAGQEVGRMNVSALDERKVIAEFDRNAAQMKLDIYRGEMTDAEIEETQAALERARAELAAIASDREKAVLRAPVAGTVVEVTPHAVHGRYFGAPAASSVEELDAELARARAAEDAARLQLDRVTQLRDAGAASAVEYAAAHREERAARLASDRAQGRREALDSSYPPPPVLAAIEAPGETAGYETQFTGGEVLGLEGPAWIWLAGREGEPPLAGRLERMGEYDWFRILLPGGEAEPWSVPPARVVVGPRDAGPLVRRSGRAVGQNGVAIAGAAIMAVGRDLRLLWETADREGRFELDLPPGPFVLLAVHWRDGLTMRGVSNEEAPDGDVALYAGTGIENVLLLPEAALDRTPPEDKAWRVWAGRSLDTPARILAPAGDGLFLVSANLLPGERILAPPPPGLRDGGPVDSDPEVAACERAIDERWAKDRERLLALVRRGEVTSEEYGRILDDVASYGSVRILVEAWQIASPR
ncbi:MAG: hypothetical protein HY720_11610 [Planctomycetes bacterium]|nr:hypothetical protein [Planctomycetota bacterium]